MTDENNPNAGGKPSRAPITVTEANLRVIALARNELQKQGFSEEKIDELLARVTARHDDHS